MKINLVPVSAAVGAVTGYLVQPTLFSVLEGAVIGLLTAALVGLLLVIVFVLWAASK